MFAGSVDAGKRFLMKEAAHIVVDRQPLHCLHDQLVMVGGQVGFLVNGGQLMLGGGHFIVLGLGGYAQFPQLFVQVLHEGADTFADDAEVMVLHLLPLGSRRSEKGTACKDQIGTFQIFLKIDQEIFLLGAQRGFDPPGFGIAEEADDPEGLGIDGLHGPQQGRLLIQGFSRIRAEGRGDAEGNAGAGFLEEGRGSNVPGGIAPGLKGGPQSAGGE